MRNVILGNDLNFVLFVFLTLRQQLILILSLHTNRTNEEKQKRDQAKAQALASKKQSDEILKSLENIIKVSNQLVITTYYCTL